MPDITAWDEPTPQYRFSQLEGYNGDAGDECDCEIPDDVWWQNGSDLPGFGDLWARE